MHDLPIEKLPRKTARHLFTNPLNQTTAFLYDAVGRLTRTTFPDTRTELRSYGGAGQLITVTDQLNQTTTYGYDAEGRMTSLTTPRNHTRQWSYDAAGRLFRRTHPNGTYEQFTYFADHQLALHRVPSAATATYTYTAAGRLAGRNWSDTTADVTYSYDNRGRVVAAVNSNSVVSWTYDLLNRKLTETQQLTGQPARVVSYQYDADGHLSRVTFPDGHPVDYSYTARHEIASVTADGPPPLATYTYNLAGELTQIMRENGVSSSSTFDAAGRQSSISHCLGVAELDAVGYTLDSMGRRTAITRPGAKNVNGPEDHEGKCTKVK
jgi:YD repeat-containing protein